MQGRRRYIKDIMMKKGGKGRRLFLDPFFSSPKPRYKTGVEPRIKRRIKFLVRQKKLLGIWFGKISVEYLKQLSDYPGFKFRFYPVLQK